MPERMESYAQHPYGPHLWTSRPAAKNRREWPIIARNIVRSKTTTTMSTNSTNVCRILMVDPTCTAYVDKLPAVGLSVVLSMEVYTNAGLIAAARFTIVRALVAMTCFSMLALVVI